MSLGATMSAPASRVAERRSGEQPRARVVVDLAVGAGSPQWPWSVYSQRHTSVITTISGTSSLMAAIASWTSPPGSQLALPDSSLLSVTPNSRTAGTPAS